MNNETWIVETGAEVIQSKVNDSSAALSQADRLIYCLWVADYSMRNAGDLATAGDLFSEFQLEAVRIAKQLSLAFTHETFSLPTESLQQEYFDRFNRVCDEIRSFQDRD